jgi:hypothetical protein
VKTHLLLAQFLPAAMNATAVSFRLPRLTRVWLRGSVGPTRLLERSGVGRLSWRVALKLLGYAYLLGVRDELPTVQQVREFVAPMLRRDGVETVPVALDRPGVIELQPTFGAVELVLYHAGRPLARVAATRPEAQWDWDALTERVIEAGLDPFRDAVRATAQGSPLADSGSLLTARAP